ncbi:Acetate kinase [Frankia canadensis]|uniref:Acetate kinase n=1 Tax=Frankia canadensis TaxID=1836972 RepID=A0A2I2KTV5_9ACTN|nr:acetate/propionate family kinase [Frankia canadensis]SNQ49087.1 Acetate kinase [Frankia canadensis]SOU56377.1 Acetate kinase [Frankia canadensis]
MHVLVVNSGSSSLKLRVIGPADDLLAHGDLDAPDGRPRPDELDAALAELIRAAGAPRDGLAAVGHRVVHGGTEFTGPVRVDAAVAARLRALTALAPLHQPAALDAYDLVRAALPDLPHVACFDTAFHSRLPAAAATYALPAAWRERHGLRRFGFHGLSHAHASRRATELTGARRVVTCHLGSGASLAAVRGGVSVDTTMGFTPLEGLVMGTRSGTVDPGALLWLQTEAGMTARELTDGLFHAAGLRGLAGTADMRAVESGARAGDAACGLALDVYLHRLRGQIAAMAAALGGLDALVFTGGVGENSPGVRAGAAAGLGFLGVTIDPERNAAPPAGAAADREIGAPRSAVRTLVLAAREDLEIARGVRSVIDRRGG